MRNNLFTAALVLAITFTLSCSKDDDPPCVSCEGGDPSGGGNFEYGSLPYQGKTYKTIEIGTQIWMAENLNYDVSGSVCYDNQASNCGTYGRLYDWATAMGLDASCNSSSCASQVTAKHRGICPQGWHIPSNADWDKLYRYADGSAGTDSPYASPTAGTKLKSRGGWNSSGGVPAGTDNYGFSALPGGRGLSDDGFSRVGNYGNWWSSSERNSIIAYNRRMSYGSEFASWDVDSKDYLFSVRCLQD
ncbi:hypothetical protein R83H12_00766 [Fibrobacteria bacterium R8-3-H12]